MDFKKFIENLSNSDIIATEIIEKPIKSIIRESIRERIRNNEL